MNLIITIIFLEPTPIYTIQVSFGTKENTLNVAQGKDFQLSCLAISDNIENLYTVLYKDEVLKHIFDFFCLNFFLFSFSLQNLIRHRLKLIFKMLNYLIKEYILASASVEKVQFTIVLG